MKDYIKQIENAGVHLLWVFLYSGLSAVASFIVSNWTGGGLGQAIVTTPILAGFLAFLHAKTQ